MKILILSDSHRDNTAVVSAVEKEKPDMLIHLGDIENDTSEIDETLGVPDKPAIYIRGNCDYSDRALRQVAVFDLCGHRFFATHGHLHSVDYGYDRLVYAAKENDCDIALFGHIHMPVYEEYAGVTVINPGSISRPRGGSKKSYIIMNLADNGELKIKFKNP